MSAIELLMIKGSPERKHSPGHGVTKLLLWQMVGWDDDACTRSCPRSSAHSCTWAPHAGNGSTQGRYLSSIHLCQNIAMPVSFLTWCGQQLIPSVPKWSQVLPRASQHVLPNSPIQLYLTSWISYYLQAAASAAELQNSMNWRLDGNI